MRSILMALVLHASVSTVFAADLEIAASTDEIFVTPLRLQSFTLIVGNNGPDAVDGIMVTGRTIDLTALTTQIVDPARCPGGSVHSDGSTATFRWQVGSLGAGDSRSCALSFRAAVTAPVQNASVLYLAEVSAPGNVDSNTFNGFSRTTINYSSIDAPVDVRIAARMDPGGILRLGAPQRLRVTVTNVGTNVVPDATILSLGYNQAEGFIGFTGYDLFEIVETAPCFMIVDAEPPFVFFVAFGFDDAPLPPGASRTCTVGIRSLPGASSVGSAELPLELFPRGPGVYDIAPQDNMAIVRVDFGSIGVPRPVPLSPIAWGLLATLVAVLGASASRCRERISGSHEWKRRA